MPHTFSDNKKIYSVDMMLAYTNLFMPKYKKIKINILIDTLDYKDWRSSDYDNLDYYSPKQVLENPNKYKSEIKRIKRSKLKYPIIINNNNIVIDDYFKTNKIL